MDKTENNKHKNPNRSSSNTSDKRHAQPRTEIASPPPIGSTAPSAQRHRPFPLQPIIELPRAHGALRPRSSLPPPLTANDLTEEAALLPALLIGREDRLSGSWRHPSSKRENTRGTRMNTRWPRWQAAKSQAGQRPPPPLGPLPSGIPLCQAKRVPRTALGQQPHRHDCGPIGPQTADGSHRDWTGSGLTRPISQHSVSALGHRTRSSRRRDDLPCLREPWAGLR
ncbi:uncharacterized protein LOC110405029 [Numida meleagris]|uniref:uncharacterized protein LOC110405029 n=1 Tax=Numida meleagris TaxID=8996 RepID=UPI000B3DB95D|nr:uncharacterized protein LOC110405029 [Numida meleagris]